MMHRMAVIHLSLAGAQPTGSGSGGGSETRGTDAQSAPDAHEDRPPAGATRVKSVDTRSVEDGEQPYRALLDSIPAAVFATDAAGRITVLNRAWTELTGFGIDESTGRRFDAGLDSESPSKTAKVFAELLAGEREEARQEFKVVARDGQTRWLDLQARVARAADGTVRGLTGTLVDVTERKWIEQTSRRFAEHLEARAAERAQALEAANADLESFAYAVSHELRAPLRGILGFTGALRDRLGEHSDGEVVNCMARIEVFSRRMVALIERMLHYARVGQVGLHPRIVDCAAMLGEVIAELQPELAGRQVDFAVNVDCQCQADPVLLRQVFSNLVGNAVKYTRRRPSARVAVDAVRTNDAMVFSVRDNGVGFDPTLAGKLFTVFQRLHSSAEFEGSGVGLATVKRIVERHGGQIWAEAKLGEGATFHFTLPAKADS